MKNVGCTGEEGAKRRLLSLGITRTGEEICTEHLVCVRKIIYTKQDRGTGVWPILSQHC